MAGWQDACLVAALTAGLLALCGETPALAGEQASTQQAGAQQAVTQQTCGGDEIARGTVSRIIDGPTFALDDGSEVRLAAQVAPAASDGQSAAAALDALAAGDQVVLRRAESGPDRYGRLVAYVYTLREDHEFLLQGELVAEGFARVGGRIASPCARDLLKRENAAREAKLGLWADPYYEVLNAETAQDALAHRGRFTLVEGKVASVRESGPTIYVNFGRRRAGDITVTVLKRNERNFAAAGLDLRTLAGRRIRVRGWVEARGGDRAWIEAERPEQIETTD
jgi:endonuclease YncB( thermonuclease family)